MTVKPKVKAAGAGGALATAIVWTATTAGVDMPAEVGSAFAVLVCVAAGWLRRDDT